MRYAFPFVFRILQGQNSPLYLYSCLFLKILEKIPAARNNTAHAAEIAIIIAIARSPSRVEVELSTLALWPPPVDEPTPEFSKPAFGSVPEKFESGS